MSEAEKIHPGERVCKNCRYLSCSQGEGLRCADPASADFDRTVAPHGTCGRFQISFEAVRRLAAAQNRQTRAQAWDMAMSRHVSPRGIGTPDVRT